MADDKTTNGELSDDEVKADEYKLQANQFFKDGKYDEALSLYTKAIDLNPQVPAYYGNRSFCYIKTEYFGSALEDANKAIDLDKKYIKAYYRRASAYMALGKFKLSLKDYEMVTKFRPKDKDASLKYQECKKIVQRLAFEKAIAVDEKKSVANTVDLNSMGFHIIIAFAFFSCQILLEVKKIFEMQPSMVDISIPENGKLTVCGDIHGQFYDLLNIFSLNGNPSAENPYLFNGDFVDRGSFSCEVIFTLFSFKLLYPDHFFMSRGNHESVYMNQMYGFEGEVKAKYPFNTIFPFKHLYFLNFFFPKGLMCELLWSDPQPQPGRSPSKRGSGIHFGPDVTKEFCKSNDLGEFSQIFFASSFQRICSQNYLRSFALNDRAPTSLLRTSEDRLQGVLEEFPSFSFFFSDQMGNKGAFITMGSDVKPNFTSYDAVPHPDVEPMAYANSFMSMFGFM
ncbi:PREDICTED: serine/threonine-protein phosphatase 5-like [Acropora digitifera]|uniref:serine/threonine-protein phosphatase 5-like n=1 Tax=Acropora digitifera TaxID=70779 RepID=UPI00077A333A|nr:PREDICTED: serine/threonine-protein phosphatase 5-like [Acropora digitifera]